MKGPIANGSVQSDWLKFEEDSRYSRDNIVLVAGLGALRSGTVLGKYTSGANDGKYGVFDPAGTTGEQTAAGILTDNVEVSATEDTAAAAIVRHAHIAASGLTWGATADLQAERDAALASLKLQGILVVREV